MTVNTDLERNHKTLANWYKTSLEENMRLREKLQIFESKDSMYKEKWIQEKARNADLSCKYVILEHEFAKYKKAMEEEIRILMSERDEAVRAINE